MSDGSTLRRTLILHEKTVRAASEIEAKRRRTVEMRRATKNKKNNSRLTIIKVHPAVWKKALRLAGGRSSRIQVLSATECIVR